MPVRVAIMENTTDNLQRLTEYIHDLLPNALVKGFTDGNAAKDWCAAHSGDVDLFIGNWWGETDEPHGPEGVSVMNWVPWKRRPNVVYIGDRESFREWSEKYGADGYILRPATVVKLRDILERMDM